jgi:hypothetical protein
MTHKSKPNPKAKVTRARRASKSFSSKITFNPPGAAGEQTPGPQGEQVDEDRSGRFIGRFHGAGMPPLRDT